MSRRLLEYANRGLRKADFMKQVSEVICAYCMLNVRMENKWNELFINSGVKKLKTEIYPMKFNGFRGMIKDEGLGNSMRVIKKYISDLKVRKRMISMNKFFSAYEDIFGYGIYIMAKDEQYKFNRYFANK